MSDDVKNTIGQFAAWFAGAIGIISFEMWLALAGLLVSAFIAWTNYRSRILQDRLLQEEAMRSVELHDLEVRRIRAGIIGPPAVKASCVKDFVSRSAVARGRSE